MLTKKCLVCDNEFIKPVNESLKNWNNRHKFCSKSCIAKFYQNGKKTRFKKGQPNLHPIKKGTHVSPKTQFKKGQKAINPFLKGHVPWNKGIIWKEMSGENHPNWKGGRSSLNEQIRHCIKMKKWIMDVFKKDNYTCQKCGRKRKKGDRVILEAHHIKEFYKIIDKNNIEFLDDAINCIELWDIKNGITLCTDCHKSTKRTNQYNKN